MLFTLAENKDKLLAGQMKKEPLAIRMNVGDCGAVTLTSEERDADVFGGYAKVEMHIHHVQFDPQGSDGTSIGFSFEHSIRPYTVEDTKLAVAAAAGSTTVKVNRIDAEVSPRRRLRCRARQGQHRGSDDRFGRRGHQDDRSRSAVDDQPCCW